MSYNVKILKDSVSPSGHRLTTMEVTFPRFLLPEINTHRVFSRNSSSSRAIPIEKIIQRVKDDPFIPEYWGVNQKGMQAYEELEIEKRGIAKVNWLEARDSAIQHVKELLELGVHKQLTNRLLEPWMWQTAIISATEWSNFFALRCNTNAQPEIRKTAELMRLALTNSEPHRVSYDEWHLPLTDDIEDIRKSCESGEFDEFGLSQSDIVCLISVGRCARVSYLTHDGKRNLRADIELALKLKSSGHFSPFEHIAIPTGSNKISEFVNCNKNYVNNSNFSPFWVQYRKLIKNENDFSKINSIDH